MAKSRAANEALIGACKLIRRCIQLGIPGYLENPRNSMIWKASLLQKIINRRGVHLVNAHMCQYGTQWRKATRLLVWGRPQFTMATCSGKGICSRTSRPHLQLSGIQGNIFATKQAQVYLDVSRLI